MPFEQGAIVDPEIRMPHATRRLRSMARLSLAALLATTALGVVSAHAVDGTWVGGHGGDPTNG